ncbi:MAG: hypothetical protein CIT03_07100 [Methanobacterium sp.]|nr:MAG: hypothetical protein CIT03_07100 [Methanobacterium sp.]
MENSNLLKISTSTGLIKVASKSQGEVFFHTIQLKLLWGYCWWQEKPAIESFLYLLESVIKKAIHGVLPHQELFLDYNLETNDSLEKSSQVKITFNQIYADNVEFQMPENILILKGPDDRGSFSRLSSFRRKLNENIQKTI